MLVRFTLVAVASFAIAGCSSTANSLLLHPTHQPLPTHAVRETIAVTEGPLAGRTLEAFYEMLSPTRGRKDGTSEESVERSAGGGAAADFYVLAITGNGGRAERTTARLRVFFRDWLDENQELWERYGNRTRPRRIAVLALQHPGFGTDRAAAQLSDLAPAATVALRSLHARAHGKPVLLHGMSMGTTSALHVARELGDLVDGVILEKPPALRSQILWQHGWWNFWLLAGPLSWGVPRELSSVDNARAVGVPGLFVLATEDEIVPEAYSRMVFNEFAGRKRVVLSRGGHNDGVSAGTCSDLPLALDWLWESIEYRRRPTAGEIGR